MTGSTGKRPGKRADRIVRKRLADGSVREYRYPRDRRLTRPEIVEQPGVRKLARAYTASPEFKRLSTRWQAAKRYYLGILEDELQWMRLSDLQHRRARTEFYALRDRWASQPPTADKLIATLAALLAWADERGMVEHNRAVGIERLAEQAPRRECVWTEEQEATAMAAFPAPLGEAVALSVLTGMRQADACALRWSQIRDGWLTYQPAKTRTTTGVWVALPVATLPALDGLLASLSRGTEFVLTSDVGHPWEARNLRTRFLAAKRSSPLAGADLHWHDLRHTCITRLYEAGCTDAEVGSISGHALGQTTAATDYLARSRVLAENAYRKLAARMAGGAKILPFSPQRTTA